MKKQIRNKGLRAAYFGAELWGLGILVFFFSDMTGWMQTLPIAVMVTGGFFTCIGLLIAATTREANADKHRNNKGAFSAFSAGFSSGVQQSLGEAVINDERYVAIGYRASSTTHYYARRLHFALLIFLVLMPVDAVVVMVFLAAYVAVGMLQLVLLHRHGKEM